MKASIKYLAQIAVALLAAAPVSVWADEPEAQGADDYNILNYNLNNEESTTSFLKLDDEGRNEMLDLDFINPNDELTADILEYAAKHLGRPYRSGSKGPSAFDCSGFTSYVFKNFGIELSPSSRTQYTQGTKIDTKDIQPGDLLFFGGRRGGSTVGHVALAVDVDENGTVKFIHAATSKGIRYDTFPDGGYYSSRYLGARRVIE